MGKRVKHNLNKMKGTKILLLVLALSFVVVPLISLLINLIMIAQNDLF